MFSKEAELEIELKGLEVREQEIRKELTTYQHYKGILTTTGETLKELVLDILRDFFGLKASGIEGFVEDISLTDEAGKVIAVAEVKGKKGGVKREHINQVDSERERNRLPADTPGLLIINDHMDEEGFSEREAHEVAKEQVEHAIKQNVLIIRTVELLKFMLKTEGEPNRAESFWKVVRGASGVMTVKAE